MDSEATRLTIRLPRRNVEFVKAYAKAHGLSVAEVIDRYLRRMRALEQSSPSPAVEAISGLVPAVIDVEEAYGRHVLRKHGR